ncbi:MAG: SDR family NAD(P)-dependent oxidoreductase [Candidatus Alcyoniella australis]|nr:SDR family NAD(P)-dependent oxidoreductase [Candidatus Alcyoniella australis]
MRLLVTGAEGFAGSHLLQRLIEDGHDVVASILRKDHPCNLVHVPGDYQVHECDLRDNQAVTTLVHEARVDAICHLAAIAFVPQALADPRRVVETNVLGTLNLLEAIRTLESDRPRLLFVSSAEVYGIQPTEAFPLTQNTPIAPVNLYASTKAAAEVLVGQYARAFGVESIVVRPFNHAGPRQEPCFALPSFARQIASIEHGAQPPVLSVGNLDARRDLLDVRDVARAYEALIAEAQPGCVYNLCSGKARRIGDLLQKLLDLSTAQIEVRPDPARMRPSDIPLMVGNNQPIVSDLGWRPQIEIETTLSDILEYARASIE